MIGRILHRENNAVSPQSSSAAAAASDEAASVRVAEVDVDGGSDSALMSTVSSAVCQLGDYFTHSVFSRPYCT